MARLDLDRKGKTLDKEKREIIRVARDLRYPTEVINSIIKAQSSFELDRIMKSARSKNQQ